MRTSLLLIPVLILALMAPVALADDASLKRAGTSRDATFETLGKQVRRAVNSWARSPRSSTRARRVVRVLRRTRTEIKAVNRALKAEQPSSDAGARYKRYLLASLRELSVSFRLQERSVLATTRGNPRLGKRYIRSADRHLKRSSRYERVATRALP